MAERRMFAKTIIDSDAFLEMPQSTQNLYFHLSMRADDDGFLNNPKKIQRMIGASDDDLKILCAKHFLIPFDSGIVVIKHWRIHNYLRSDRYKPTVYIEEKGQLEIKENGAYTMALPKLPEGSGVVYQCETQDSIGKVRLGKDSIEEERGDPTDTPHFDTKNEPIKQTFDNESGEPNRKPRKKRVARPFVKPTIAEIQAYCQSTCIDIDPVQFYNFYEAGDWHDSNGKAVQNWKQKAVTWGNKDKKSNGNGGGTTYNPNKPKRQFIPTD